MRLFNFVKKPIYIRPLYLIYSFNLIVLFGVVFGFLPREMLLAGAALVLFYCLLMPLKDSILFFLASIPFFVALPLASNFDALNLWRVAILIIFGRFFFKKFPLKLWRQKNFWAFLPKRIWQRLSEHKIELWAMVYFGVMFLSILVAYNKVAALKRFLYIGEMALIYPLVLYIARSKPVLKQIIKVLIFSAVLVLIIGVGQWAMTYSASLNGFWDWWADHFSYNFYGQHLAGIVKHANTWFSYYPGRAPTLRMFSSFTDSHSFALYLLLVSPLLLWQILKNYLNKNKKWPLIISGIILFIAFQLAIMLSGTRGIWISVSVPLVFSFMLIVKRKGIFLGKFIFKALVIFLLMLPVSSLVLSVPQFQIQMRDHQTIDKSLALERLKTVVDLNETSNKGRIYIWRKSAEALLHYPILGVGIGNFPVVLGQDPVLQKAGSTAHNVYLNSGVEMGILGLIAIVMVFYEILKLCWRHKNCSFNGGDKMRCLPFVLGFYFLWAFTYSLFDIALFDARVMMVFVAEIAVIMVIAWNPKEKTAA